MANVYSADCRHIFLYVPFINQLMSYMYVQNGWRDLVKYLWCFDGELQHNSCQQIWFWHHIIYWYISWSMVYFIIQKLFLQREKLKCSKVVQIKSEWKITKHGIFKTIYLFKYVDIYIYIYHTQSTIEMEMWGHSRIVDHGHHLKGKKWHQVRTTKQVYIVKW